MKAMIAMSGGVDSSVTAYLVKEMGYDCLGCTMKLYENEDAGVSRDKGCCSLDDAQDAKAVAYRLGMPHYTFSFTEEFHREVMERFTAQYRRGRTPNPCIDCNRYLKFGALTKRAKTLGCDKIATGHYARITFDGEKYHLKKALDPTKDQSYVLYAMTQEELAHTLFPLGEMTKEQVRALAEEKGFVTAHKPDSQDICFVPDGNYAAAIDRLDGRETQPGDFVDRTGKVLGRHKGITHYTVGQRRGLGIAAEQPLYVCAVDAEKNQVILGTREELRTVGAETEAFHWIAGTAPAFPLHAFAMLRYRKAEVPCTVTAGNNGGVRVLFDQPQDGAVTPGQALVLYDGDEVLGGGEIERSLV